VYRRHITTVFTAALQDSPVVLLVGARQVGKSTLVQSLTGEGSSAAQYLTLDDPTILAAAHGNPSGFVDGLSAPVIIDEIQRAPELLVLIKLAVDRRRAPGSFILTGSANVLTLPAVSESLAGRMEVLTLRPLSQGEIIGQQETFIKRLFAGEFKLPKKPPPEERAALFARMMTGGYPEVVTRQTQARKNAWFKSYITTILQRDIRDLANIEGLVDLPRLLSLLAARAGGLLNFAEVSRSIGFAQTTLKRYFALLEMTFLIETLPAWSGSRTKQLVKAPKLFLSDTGLLSFLQGLTWERLQLDPTLAGALPQSLPYE
jgi:predicted AAA+ superfamily ATPase